MPGAVGGQKRALDSPGIAVVDGCDLHVDVGDQPQVLCKCSKRP